MGQVYVSRYHKVLRVSALVAASILAFDSGYISSLTRDLSNNTIDYLASSLSSVSVAVPENELNVITTQLTARERELDAREAALKEREISSRNFTSPETDYSTYIISLILFLLTTLILLNYALDWLRAKKLSYYEG